MGNISVRKRSNGWEYNFYTSVVDGKRGRKYKGGFRTKSEALQAGIKAKAEYDKTGIAFTPTEQSVSDFFDYWIESYCRKELAETTVYGYEKKIRLYIKPYIGDYKLKSVTQETLRNLIYTLHERQLSRNTLTSVKGILNNAFSYAVNTARYIAVDPTAGLRLPNKRADIRVGTYKKERIVTPPEKWQEIISRFPEGTSAHIPLMIAYHCGCRLGEVFGLTWDCIDLDSKTLCINKQVQYIETKKEWLFRRPKYESVRTIVISDELCDLLARHKLSIDYYKSLLESDYTTVNMNYDSKTGKILQDDRKKPVSLVMVREDGSWCSPRITQHIGRVIHGKANNCPCIMEQWDFHSLRHTHATMLLEAGIPLPLIQQRLGHANINTTEYYSNHVTDSMQENLRFYLNSPPKKEK